MKELNFYEFVAVVIPGVLLVFGLFILFYPSQIQTLQTITSISIGGFGLGLILGYVAGQLLQAVGNWFEKGYWSLFGGMPTDWVRTGKKKLLASTQISRLEKIVRDLQDDENLKLSELTSHAWYSITREIDKSIVDKGSSKVYIFNANYGLNRGLTIVFIFLFVGIYLHKLLVGLYL